MDTNKNTIMCLACILISLGLQFCLGPSFILSIIGCLILLIGPRLVSNDYIYDINPKFNSSIGSPTVERWKTFDAQTGLDFCNKISTEHIAPARNKSILDRFLCFFGSIPMRVIAWLLTLGCFIGSEPQLAAFCFNIAYVPLALFYLKYGTSPSDAFDPPVYSSVLDRSKLANVNYLARHSLDYSEFEVHPQFLISHCGEYNKITDAKIELQYRKKYKNLLCAMISISMNSVQTSKYAFSYFVLVLKGNKHKRLTSLLSARKTGHFGLDIKHEEGNTIYVMTKKNECNEAYATNEDDCIELLSIINKTAAQLEEACGIDETNPNEES